jgi:ketosteroid isomerase-like protein
MMEMNVDDMLAYYSDTDFQELLLGISVYTSLDSFKNDVIEMFSTRENQSGENLEIKVTVLFSDTAYVSSAHDYTINYKDERKYQGKAVQTSIWKKGTAGWKITHDHVSWAGKYLEE